MEDTHGGKESMSFCSCALFSFAFRIILTFVHLGGGFVKLKKCLNVNRTKY